ncbi:MAG TPA: amidohydrolase family protein [Pseudonocardia sp.]|nr:amidohydrolase family protein [Pseudonocardia sp.]
MTITAEDPIPRLISVDDHVVEPRDVWSSRLPAKYADAGPRVEYLPKGIAELAGGEWLEVPGDGPELAAWWRYEDKLQSIKRVTAAVGYPPDEVGLHSVSYEEMRPGCYDAVARLADMDVNGVEASLCFPSFPRFCGQIFMRAQDKDLSLLCVRAYNDWMVEEWCGKSDGRLLPLCLIPLWDVDLAVAEVHRNAARGVRGVAFSECPPWLGLPSIHSGYWDPFFRACEETGTVVCAHVGSGTKTLVTSADAPDAVTQTLLFTNSAAGILDYLLSGVLVRFPALRVLFAECQIGWIPHVLERVDDIWVTHRGWALSHESVPEPPSNFFRRNIWVSFFRDEAGIDLIEKIGVDRACFEVDYPHQDSTWPNSRDIALDHFGHLPAEQIYQLARGNAETLFGLTPVNR